MPKIPKKVNSFSNLQCPLYPVDPEFILGELGKKQEYTHESPDGQL